MMKTSKFEPQFIILSHNKNEKCIYQLEPKILDNPINEILTVHKVFIQDTINNAIKLDTNNFSQNDTQLILISNNNEKYTITDLFAIKKIINDIKSSRNLQITITSCLEKIIVINTKFKLNEIVHENIYVNTFTENFDLKKIFYGSMIATSVGIMYVLLRKK